MKDSIWEKIKRFFRLGDSKFLYGPYAGRKGWIGGDDPIYFPNRPDPLHMTRDERHKEMMRQISEDLK